MSAERNTALARRYFEEFLGGNVALGDELLSEDIAFYGPNYWGEVMRGREAVKGFVGYLRSAFPDLHFVVHDEIATADRVASSFTLRGTHRGEWMGLEPTGKSIDLPGADLFRIVDGRIAEIRVFYDTLGLMQQLGFAPMPMPTGAAAG